MTLATTLVLAFVVYRCARLIAIDTISDPLRARFYVAAQNADPEHRSAARWLLKLVTCPFCVGVHLSFIVVLFWSLVVVDRWLGWGYPLAALAVAGAQCLMTAADGKLTRHD